MIAMRMMMMTKMMMMMTKRMEIMKTMRRIIMRFLIKTIPLTRIIMTIQMKIPKVGTNHLLIRQTRCWQDVVLVQILLLRVLFLVHRSEFYFEIKRGIESWSTMIPKQMQLPLTKKKKMPIIMMIPMNLLIRMAKSWSPKKTITIVILFPKRRTDIETAELHSKRMNEWNSQGSSWTGIGFRSMTKTIMIRLPQWQQQLEKILLRTVKWNKRTNRNFNSSKKLQKQDLLDWKSRIDYSSLKIEKHR